MSSQKVLFDSTISNDAMSYTGQDTGFDNKHCVTTRLRLSPLAWILRT